MYVNGQSSYLGRKNALPILLSNIADSYYTTHNLFMVIIIIYLSPVAVHSKLDIFSIICTNRLIK